MIDPKIVYPALYESADQAAVSAQRLFLWNIRVEYFFLFSVSVIGVFRNQFNYSSLVISLFLILLGALFLFRMVSKSDQAWYRCRALAESVKTSTWRFSMRSHPFEDAISVDIPKTLFQGFLREILEANRHMGSTLSPGGSEQVTDSMVELRNLAIRDRLIYYMDHRIRDQQDWYKKKSEINRRALRRWSILTCALYIVAIASANGQLPGGFMVASLFDPLIVLVTSLIGWLQIKRHGELMATYNLTVHEIGIVRAKADHVETEDDLSVFVNEAELAFSREHTQWVARQSMATS